MNKGFDKYKRKLLVLKQKLGGLQVWNSFEVNAILHRLLTAIPPTAMVYHMDGQTPSSPPIGQGLVDRKTLTDRPKTVVKD